MTDKIGGAAALPQLEGWAIVDGDRDAIEKTFRLGDFKTAWAFMSGAALKAEQMDHHPEWFNVYNRVEVVLTTHDAGGVTQKDVELGQFMDALASRLGSA
ncbi:MAG: 4a-hydroxytetrahydrobiopterin dehydratase [Pseudomonadota bacterium]